MNFHHFIFVSLFDLLSTPDTLNLNYCMRMNGDFLISEKLGFLNMLVLEVANFIYKMIDLNMLILSMKRYIVSTSILHLLDFSTVKVLHIFGIASIAFKVRAFCIVNHQHFYITWEYSHSYYRSNEKHFHILLYYNIFSGIFLFFSPLGLSNLKDSLSLN